MGDLNLLPQTRRPLIAMLSHRVAYNLCAVHVAILNMKFLAFVTRGALFPLVSRDSFIWYGRPSQSIVRLDAASKALYC